MTLKRNNDTHAKRVFWRSFESFIVLYVFLLDSRWRYYYTYYGVLISVLVSHVPIYGCFRFFCVVRCYTRWICVFRNKKRTSSTSTVVEHPKNIYIGYFQPDFLLKAKDQKINMLRHSVLFRAFYMWRKILCTEPKIHRENYYIKCFVRNCS